MRIFPVLSLPLIAAVVFAHAPSARADGAVTVTTDKDQYIDGFSDDRVVRIAIGGLQACAGREVEVALFDAGADGSEPPTPFEGRSRRVAVPANGTVTVEIPVLWERSGTIAHAGVRDACVPGGIALGGPLTFLHGDPPFGPVLPPAPLPDGVSIDVQLSPGAAAGGSRPPVLVVRVAGFEQCAGRALTFNLAREDGSPVGAPGQEPSWSAPVDASSAFTASFDLSGVPPGRYIVWIRSVCTGTWVAPGAVELSGPGPSGEAGRPAPGPPAVGSGVRPPLSNVPTGSLVALGLIALGFALRAAAARR